MHSFPLATPTSLIIICINPVVDSNQDGGILLVAA